MRKNSLFTLMLILSISYLFGASAPVRYSGAGDGKGGGESSVKALSGDLDNVVPSQQLRVHKAGMLWLSATNMGHFGNPNNLKDPATGLEAPGGQLLGDEFLFVGSIWFGGYLDSVNVDILNQDEQATVFAGPFVSTGYEGWQGDGGGGDQQRELYPVGFEDDIAGTTLGAIKETSNLKGRINDLFEQVYDPTATAEEQFTTGYTDKFVRRVSANEANYTGMCDIELRQHRPMGIEVIRKSYAWSYEYAQKFIIIDYTIYNKNDEHKNIYNFFMGVYLDCDIGPNSEAIESADDMGGFIQKWTEYQDPATGKLDTVDLNLAWAADNDGRSPIGGTSSNPTEAPAGAELDGATGVVTLRVLRNPNPNLRFAFNMYVADSNNESKDWGPHWYNGLHMKPTDPTTVTVEDPNTGATKTVEGLPWMYDLTHMQKGYDDTNYDGLKNDAGQDYVNGRVEGRALGDRGRYMMMSNDEFDYNQYDLKKVYDGEYEDPAGTAGTSFAQADKFTPWKIGSSDDPAADGSYEDMMDLQNGRDVKYVLSFGPLGTETTVDVAVDANGVNGNGDGVAEDAIRGKKVWEFGYGDSLKLTLAFIVSENFHTSKEQTANDPEGINPDYFKKGWYDALANVMWAERVYDIPMRDTPVRKIIGGEIVEHGDGWYGEDVGSDGVYADAPGLCWWSNTNYAGPDKDGTEGNYKLDKFNETAPAGIDGTSEDDLMKYGRTVLDENDSDHGFLTGNNDTGGDWGYMVKVPVSEGSDVLEWVRYGYKNDKLDFGDGVPDFTGPPPPPSPKIKIAYENDKIVIEWKSKEIGVDSETGEEIVEGPELFIDPFSRRIDFEGYKVLYAARNISTDYVEFFSVDKENLIYEDIMEPGKYYDVPFTYEERQHYIDNPGEISEFLPTGYYTDDEFYDPIKDKVFKIVEFGDNRSLYEPHGVEGMYSYTVTQDETDSDLYTYRIVLEKKMYAKKQYFAVIATDTGDPKSGTPKLQSSPATNGAAVVPSQLKNDDDVYVVPNPYRVDVDYEAMGWEDPGDDDWGEQDRKIVFFNLPEQAMIKIYTLSGDLVRTLSHNGKAKEQDKYGERAARWNLINENEQAVTSGVYLYSVIDVNDDNYEFVGKFVIIK